MIHTPVVTLPCHNEEDFLEVAHATVKCEAEKLFPDYVILIAEDGSTDRTLQIAKKLCQNDPNTILIHSERKLGRGKALKEAWRKVEADAYVYLDCDMATDMSAFPKLFLGLQEGYDIVTGSRYLKGSQVDRPSMRHHVSMVYNWMVRALFSTGISDHQCGFKALSKRMVRTSLLQCRSDGWFFDTEMIIRAKRNGFSILEIGIKWKERRGKRTSVTRLIKDVWIHGTGIVALLTNR